MTAPEPTAATPFSEYAVVLLLSGPAAVGPPNERDPALRAELRTIWGAHGERIAQTWAANESWLREQAAVRGIPARFHGRFFGECKAAEQRAVNEKGQKAMIDKSQWTNIYFADRVMAADQLLQKSPEALTDRDIDALESYFGNGAQARRARDAAIDSARRKAGAQAKATTAAHTTWRKGESLAAWVKRSPLAPTPLALFNALLPILKEQSKEREYLESRVTVLATEQAALRALVTGLEANAATRGVNNVRWAGTYESGHSYRSGELVSRNGVWVCTAETTTTQPGSDPSSWKLIIHRKLVPTDDGK